MVAIATINFNLFYLIGFLSGFCDTGNNIFSSVLMTTYKNESYSANSAALFLITCGMIFFVLIGITLGFNNYSFIFCLFITITVFAAATANFEFNNNNNSNDNVTKIK